MQDGAALWDGRGIGDCRVGAMMKQPQADAVRCVHESDLQPLYDMSNMLDTHLPATAAHKQEHCFDSPAAEPHGGNDDKHHILLPVT